MKHLLLVILTVLCVGTAPPDAGAQTVTSDKIKPGKEKIVLELPKEQRWRRQRIPKETPSIRAWSYRPTRGDTASLAVRSLETSTIDRRYYPVNARRTMTDKITFVQGNDPGARLEILHDQLVENRTSVIYAVFPGETVADEGDIRAEADTSGGTVMLVLATEGPTAFHTVEIRIPAAQASREFLEEWVGVLRLSKIQ